MAEPKKDAKQEIPVKFKKIVDEIDKLGALDLSELVKVLEEHYQVTAAAAPVAMATSSVSNAGSEPASVEEQKSEFDVILKDPGAQKVAVIKAVKDVTGLGLGEAKAIVDSAPKTLKEKVKKEEAEEIKAKLAEAGAVVEIV